MAEGSPGSGSNSGGESGNSSGVPSSDELSRMINDAVSKTVGARLGRAKLEEQIAAAVQKALAAGMPATAQAEPAEGKDHGDPDPRLNLKTLDSNYKALKQELERERQARQAAEQSAIDTRKRQDLQNAFAKHAGADNPHLNAYLNLYANQFKVDNGVTLHVRRDEFGNEEMVPLDVAAEQLFKGELKHLVPSKTPNLPPSSIARGMPMGQAPQSGQPRTGFLEQEILHAQAMSDPAVYHELYGAKKPQ